jgi:hypothetical protein
VPDQIDETQSQPLENAQEEQFVQAILSGIEPGTAYLATFPERSPEDPIRAGKRFLSKNHIAARLDTLRRQLDQRPLKEIYMRAEWVLDRLYKLIENTGEVREVEDDEGEVRLKPGPLYDAKVNLQALKLMGTQLQLFIERKDIRITDETPLAQAASDEERTALTVMALRTMGINPQRYIPAVTDSIDVEIVSEESHEFSH